MGICSDGHEIIVFDGHNCPLCDLQTEIKELKAQISDLNDQIEELNERE